MERSAEPKPSAVFFAEYFPPYMGSDRRIFEIARRLEHWDLEFAVIPPIRALTNRCEQALQAYFHRNFIQHGHQEKAKEPRGTYLRIPWWLLPLWRTIWMPAAYALTLPYFLWQAVAMLRLRRPDLVVVAHPSYLCGAVATIAARILRLPLLLDVPDAWTPLAVETAGVSRRGSTARILRLLEAAIARAADRIVAITGGIAEHVRALGATRAIDIVPNGGDAEHFNVNNVLLKRADFGLDAGDEIILYAGRFEAWSGARHILEIVDYVCAQRPKATFVFVGDGSASQDLQASLRSRNLESRARFLGFIEYAMMPSVCAVADVAIVPFEFTPATEFCSPVKIFECVLMGTPVVTTDLPGIRESFKDGDVTFVYGFSPERFGAAIVASLVAPAPQTASASAPQCARAECSWGAIAQRFSQSMFETLAEARVRARKPGGARRPVAVQTEP
jgi:glycosyltransferase involved in cell wall biosynthesis